MPTPMSELRGITVDVEAKLKDCGIKNVEQYLEAAKTSAGRKELAKTSGVDGKIVLELANRADLARVKGIGKVYADLLENAGVDTMKELAHRVPANLHDKLVEINKAQKLTTHPPTLEMVTAWIDEAKALPKLLEY